METRRSFTDVLAGAIFVVIGGAFVVAALGYELGTPLRMGPGYFPAVVGGVLAAFGVAIIVKGLVAGEVLEFGRIPWRAVVVIVAALIFFGAMVRNLGFIPTVAVTALLAALASTQVRLRTAAAISAGLTALSTVIFIYGLQLRLPLWGPWLPF